jgi:hypothetical protein
MILATCSANAPMVRDGLTPRFGDDRRIRSVKVLISENFTGVVYHAVQSSVAHAASILRMQRFEVQDGPSRRNHRVAETWLPGEIMLQAENATGTVHA